MQAIKMSIFSLKDVTRKEQLEFVNKMYTYPYAGIKGTKIGVFEKFASSIGYRAVDWHYVGEGLYEDEKVKSPDNYVSPLRLLQHGVCFFNEKNELLSFLIEVKDIEHPKKEYSYNTFDIMVRFQEFLYKVYGDYIKIKFKIEKSAKLRLKDWLLAHFYTLTAMGEVYETECSLERMLTKREKRYILDIISKYTSYKPDISQFYCETCAEYDKTRPYHTMLIDVEEEKKWEQEDIKNGLYVRYLKEGAI